MSDKELIKQEIERRINDLKGYVLQKGSDQRWVTAIDQLTWIKAFIDSFPEEPGCEVNFTTKSEDLEEEIENYIKDSLAIKFPTTDKEQIKDDIRYIAHHFAEWQKQQMMKDAVNGEVVYEIGNSVIAPTDIRYKVMSDRVYIPNVKLGDKVKIIILKEEQ